jgi:hypothetical protein
MTIVIQNKIRKAACFDDIVQAFGEHFGFNVESWKHQADEGRAILEKIDYARSLSNPIDKAIAGASMSENLPSDKALRFAGLDPGTYKANVAEIFPLAENGKPETSLGKVTYEQYFKDGVLSPDVKNIAQKHFKISSQIEDLRKRVAEKTAEINKRTQEKVDEYYYKSDLSEAKDNIVRVNRKISELGKKLQRKINNGAISIEEADREYTKFNKIYKDQAKKDWETLNRIQGEVAEIYKRSVIEVNNACGNLNNDIEKLTTESLKPGKTTTQKTRFRGANIARAQAVKSGVNMFGWMNYKKGIDKLTDAACYDLEKARVRVAELISQRSPGQLITV